MKTDQNSHPNDASRPAQAMDAAMAGVKPPVTWFGSKARLAAWIIQHFPGHQAYCEPFGGSAAVLLAKPASAVEIYNDIDGDLVNLFRVLREEPLFERLQAALDATLYARAEFEIAQQACEEPVERARRFIVRQRQSHGGLGLRWSYSIEDTAAGMSSSVRRWLCGLERMPQLHQRMKAVQIEQDDWRSVMQRYDTPRTLFYLDPPYVPQTRGNGGYAHEMTEQDHRQMVDFLSSVQGMVVLSGYGHDTYQPLEDAGWLRVDQEVPAYASDSRGRRIESLWLSPSAQACTMPAASQDRDQGELFMDGSGAASQADPALCGA